MAWDRRPPLVYIAGPFTAADDLEIERNIVAAELRAKRVIEYTTAAPIVPHSLGRSFKNIGDPLFWYDVTLELLRRCDALLLPEEPWESSKGTRQEVFEAEKLGIPVFGGATGFADLCAWLAHNPFIIEIPKRPGWRGDD